MHILVMPDKFKGSMTSPEAAEAIRQGLQEAVPGLEVTCLPLSDGGDGWIDVWERLLPAERRTEIVPDPLLRPVQASWLWAPDQRLAVVEMAAASGLHLLTTNERDARHTTSLGTGALLAAALRAGAQKILLGIGGSATNDAGTGIATALGFRFLDSSGTQLPLNGASLIHLHRIDRSGAMDLSDVELTVATDVRNLLTGPRGATRVYGPQKGLHPEAVEELERGMEHWAEVVRKETGIDVLALEGGGAAGGAGAGCLALLGAQLQSGIQLLLQYSGAERKMQSADWVITGEGRLDDQSGEGKLIEGVCQLAAAFGKRVIALCGSVTAGPETLSNLGLHAAFSITDGPVTLEEAIANGKGFLRKTAFQIGKLLKPHT